MPDATHLTITIPGRLSPTQTAALEDRLHHALESTIGPCELDRESVPLNRDDARLTGYALLTLLRLHKTVQEEFDVRPLLSADKIHEIAHRLLDNADERAAWWPAPPNGNRSSGDLTREQECAVDAMASKYGRSAVRPLADGAVQITGMTDDVVFETVCIERDGRERWRR